jgi:hypothetical protein
MRTRCRNPRSRRYNRYGGRGISICAEWDSFPVFREWALENGYRDDLSIDRIDNDGDYKPENCRWATQKEQMRNSSINVVIDGKCLAQWSEEIGVSYGAIQTRSYLGKSREAILCPITHNGIERLFQGLSLKQWSKKTGIKVETLRMRIWKGWSFESAINTPLLRKSNRTATKV